MGKLRHLTYGIDDVRAVLRGEPPDPLAVGLELAAAHLVQVGVARPGGARDEAVVGGGRRGKVVCREKIILKN